MLPLGRITVLTGIQENGIPYSLKPVSSLAMVIQDTASRRNIKTTVELPQELWRAAKIRAMDEHTDFRSVVIAALEFYLQLPPDSARTAT